MRHTRFEPLPAFDRGLEFIVTRTMKVQGRGFNPGQPFDKTLVTTRRLRLLFEQRQLRYAVPAQSNGHDPASEVKPVKVGRVRMKRKDGV